jgi:formate dehydrogenase assembly factor FdhD
MELVAPYSYTTKIEIHGARENEGIVESIAEENRMDVERTETQMQVSTSRKRKVKGRGAQQRCYRCGKSRMEKSTTASQGVHQTRRNFVLCQKNIVTMKVGRTGRVKCWRRTLSQKAGYSEIVYARLETNTGGKQHIK